MKSTTVKFSQQMYEFYTGHYKRIGTGLQRAADSYQVLFQASIQMLVGTFYAVDIRVMAEAFNSFLLHKPDASIMTSTAMRQMLTDGINRLGLEQKYTFDRELLENKFKMLDPTHQYFLLESLRAHILTNKLDRLIEILDAGVE